MHAGQLIVLSLLFPTLPQEMPSQTPPGSGSSSAPSYGAPIYPASSNGTSRETQENTSPPRISPDYNGMPASAPPSRLNFSSRSPASETPDPASSEDSPPVYRLLSGEQGQGGTSSSPVMPAPRFQVGDANAASSGNSGSRPTEMSLRANTGGGLSSDPAAPRRLSSSGQDLGGAGDPRGTSGSSSLQVPSLRTGQGGGAPPQSSQSPTLPGGYDRNAPVTRDDGSRVMPSNNQLPPGYDNGRSSASGTSNGQGLVPTADRWQQSTGGASDPRASQTSRAGSPNNAQGSLPATQFPTIDDSNTGTATEYLRSAMFHIPYGEDGLDGTPMRLEEVLSLSRGSDERLRTCQAYWQLAVAVADYHFAMDELQWLRELSRPQARVDQSYLAAAVAGADARYRETRLAVLSRQYELTEASSALSSHELPLPLDAPFIGRYATQFDLYARNRAMPSGLAKIDRALPLMLELISTRAKATAASQVAMVDARSGYDQGAISVNEVVDRFMRTRDQRLALLGAVRDYNHLIAEYAFAVQPAQAEPGRVVAMLIDTKDRANARWEEIDPSIRQATRPTTSFRNPSSTSSPPFRSGFQR